MTAHEGSLLKEIDLDRKELLSLIELAGQLKRERAGGTELPRLTGRHIALLFETTSTRVRCAFEVAAADQGARVTFVGPDGSHLGREESVRDLARVLGRIYDGFAVRGHDQETAEQFAAAAGVPVWNAGTDSWTPTQSLADILTMSEQHGGPLEDIAFCYTGDGRTSSARSLLIGGCLLGMDVRIAAPAGLQPPDAVVATATVLAEQSGARLHIGDDPYEAVRGADFVHTDSWVTLGESEEDWARRVEHLMPYRVSADLLAGTGKVRTRFMHPLPAAHNTESTLGARLHYRFGLDGIEVTEQVFESPASLVFEQAENRMHAIKAVLVAALGG